MGKYIVKRVLLAIVSILIVSAITFFVMNIIPGGPFNKEKATSAEAQKVLEERYNLDKPIPEQYVIYMNNLLHGDGAYPYIAVVISGARFLPALRYRQSLVAWLHWWQSWSGLYLEVLRR